VEKNKIRKYSLLQISNSPWKNSEKTKHSGEGIKLLKGCECLKKLTVAG